jgi:apolipoprotein D and lipocalin family protein
MFEKGAYNATETYTWNQEKNRVDIDFRYNKNAFDGPEKKIPQKGFVYNQTTKAEWRVQPIWPLKFAYLIIDLAKDYSDTVVGVPNRQYVWIMARQKTMTDVRYNELVKKLESLGYDIAKLQKVPQR